MEEKVYTGEILVDGEIVLYVLFTGSEFRIVDATTENFLA